jgi:hypothetical protein
MDGRIRKYGTGFAPAARRVQLRITTSIEHRGRRIGVVVVKKALFPAGH